VAYSAQGMVESARALVGRFASLELQFDYDGVTLPPPPTLINDLVALREKHSLRYAVHLPLSIALASDNRALRQASVDSVKEVLSLLSPLSPEAFVLHVAPLVRLDERSTGRERLVGLEASARNVANAREALARLLDGSSVPSRLIAIENIDYPFELINPIVEEHDLGICCDTGHLLLQGEDPARFVRSYSARLIHVHLHDVVDGFDHRALGNPAGRIDLVSFLETLSGERYGGLITLEVSNDDDLEKSMVAISPYLRAAA
jgi:sugar phosphate isomerase/epimerase